jgi:hypothetical protein
MIREDALSLFKELREAFLSLQYTQLVSVTKEKETDNWFLCAKWIANKSDKPTLNGLALKYHVKTSEIDGYTFFRTQT